MTSAGFKLSTLRPTMLVVRCAFQIDYTGEYFLARVETLFTFHINHAPIKNPGVPPEKR